MRIIVNTLTPVNYQWIPESNLNCADCNFNRFAAIEDTEYMIIGYDVNDCPDTTYFNLVVDEQPRSYVPNAFSPNGDGTNDIFMIYSPGDVAIVNSLQIFDRWGSCVFNKSNFLPNSSYYGWDGTFKGKKMMSGVYIYMLETTLINGSKEILKGDLNLIR